MFCKIKLKTALEKQPIFLLNGEVIWQASDSPLSKELQDLPILLSLYYSLSNQHTPPHEETRQNCLSDFEKIEQERSIFIDSMTKSICSTCRWTLNVLIQLASRSH